MVEQKYCRNCGEPTLQDAAYCANCGAAFATSAAAPPRTAPSAAPSPPPRQPSYTPPPPPPPRSRTIFGLSRKMIVVGLVVVVLLLTLGCVALMVTAPPTNPTATPTATTPLATTTPTATPSTATFDPVLKKLESQLNTEYPNATLIKEAPAGTVESVDLLRIVLTLPNGNVVMGTASNGTIEAQTQRYQTVSQPSAGLVSDPAQTHFGQSAAQAALGGLSTSADTSLKFTDTASTYNEYLLYTNTNAGSAILFEINVGPNPLA